MTHDNGKCVKRLQGSSMIRHAKELLPLQLSGIIIVRTNALVVGDTV